MRVWFVLFFSLSLALNAFANTDSLYPWCKEDSEVDPLVDLNNTPPLVLRYLSTTNNSQIDINATIEKSPRPSLHRLSFKKFNHSIFLIAFDEKNKNTTPAQYMLLVYEKKVERCLGKLVRIYPSDKTATTFLEIEESNQNINYSMNFDGGEGDTRKSLFFNNDQIKVNTDISAESGSSSTEIIDLKSGAQLGIANLYGDPVTFKDIKYVLAFESDPYNRKELKMALWDLTHMKKVFSFNPYESFDKVSFFYIDSKLTKRGSGDWLEGEVDKVTVITKQKEWLNGSVSRRVPLTLPGEWAEIDYLMRNFNIDFQDGILSIKPSEEYVERVKKAKNLLKDIPNIVYSSDKPVLVYKLSDSDVGKQNFIKRFFNRFQKNK